MSLCFFCMLLKNFICKAVPHFVLFTNRDIHGENIIRLNSLFLMYTSIHLFVRPLILKEVTGYLYELKNSHK